MPKLDEQPHSPARYLLSLGLAALVIAFLYFGYELLMPTALAGMLSFLLWPLVERLRRTGVPSAVAVTVVTLSAAAFVIALIVFVSVQIVDVGSEMKQYKENLASKVRALRSSSGGFEEISDTFRDLQHEMAGTTRPTTAETVVQEIAPGAAPAATQPVPVVIQAETDLFDLLASRFGPVLSPLGAAAMVFVMLFFLLIDHDHIQDRLRWATRRYRLWDAVDALDDAAERVGRYLRMQAIINISYGAIVAIAMLALGLPNALLWGVIATVLRYIPYIGPWLAAGPPIVLSIAVFPDWHRPLIVAGAFIVAETLTNGIMEPMLYGSSTGVSTIGVVASTFFWGWLWGPVGLVLAMPITVCLVVIGRHIAPIAPLALLLSADELAPLPKPDAAPPPEAEPEAAPPSVGVETQAESGLI